MKEMKMPTKEQILKASKQCIEVDRVMHIMFPEAFKEEWVDITGELTFKADQRGSHPYWWIPVYHKKLNYHIGYLDFKGFHLGTQYDNRYKLEHDEDCENFRIFKKI